MGRPSSGWKLRPSRGPGRVRTVRFWVDGAEFERSTGTSDPQEAAREAARIYADAVQRGGQRRKRVGFGLGPQLEELLAAWLVTLASTHDAGTCKTWELYAFTHWVLHFGATHHLNDQMCAEYMRARLLVVQGTTVRKELTALRQFLKWCHEEMKVLAQPVKVPSVPKRSLGTKFAQRRRVAAVDISPDESEALIAALPDWSESKKVPPFPIRARFLVGYETSLRPSTLDKLELGVHYRPGSATITLTPELDKSRWGRDVPLSERARVALDAVCARLELERAELSPDEIPGPVLIFGVHDYRERLEVAAKAALPEHKVAAFAGTHLRSARITHWLEDTGNLPGTQYLAGHKLTSTTARYVKPSLRAAMDVVSAVERSRKKKPAKRSK
jgi:site-specific recombinase XerC